MYLSPLISVSSIVEVFCLFICFRSNKNLVKFIRFGIVGVARNLILWWFSSDGPHS